MIGFLLFLLVVSAAGFVYLTFQSRWQVKDEITMSKLDLNSAVITGGTISNANKIEFPKANEIIGVVQTQNYTSDLPKSAPRINQAHWQTRTFERPRRKVKR